MAGFTEIRPRPVGFAFRWIPFCRWLSQYDSFGLIAADVMDGYYSVENSLARLRLADCAAKLGLNSVLLGFSYRADPAPGALAGLKEYGPGIKVLSRDPLSWERVRRLAEIPAELVADLAFLMKPDCSSERVREITSWAGVQRAKGSQLVAINCNPQVLGQARLKEADTLARVIAGAAETMAQRYPNLGFIVVPHDSRGEMSDVTAARAVWGALTEPTRQKSKLVNEVWSAPEIKAVTGLVDYAITGRMHFGIACLGSGVPVGSLTYQDKFEGLYQHFGISNVTIPGVDGLDPQRVLSLFERMHQSAGNLRASIQAKLPEVMTLARRNVDALLRPATRGN